MTSTFLEALVRWKSINRLSCGQVGDILKIDPSLVSLVVTHKRQPTLNLAQVVYLRVNDSKLHDAAKAFLLGEIK
jgi:hypothetical protein